MMLEEEKKDDLSVNSMDKLSADNMFSLGGFLTPYEAASVSQTSYKINQKSKIHAQLAAFQTKYSLNFGVPFPSEEEQLKIYIVLEKLKGSYVKEIWGTHPNTSMRNLSQKHGRQAFIELIEVHYPVSLNSLNRQELMLTALGCNSEMLMIKLQELDREIPEELPLMSEQKKVVQEARKNLIIELLEIQERLDVDGNATMRNLLADPRVSPVEKNQILHYIREILEISIAHGAELVLMLQGLGLSLDDPLEKLIDKQNPKFLQEILDELLQGILGEETKRHLVAICKKDIAMAHRVSNTPLLLAALPITEKKQKSLFSKILGGLIGLSAALLKPPLYCFNTFLYLVISLFCLPIAFCCVCKNTIAPADDDSLTLSEALKFYATNIVNIVKLLAAPIFLPVSMADSIYTGYKIGGKNAWINYDDLLTYKFPFNRWNEIIYTWSDTPEVGSDIKRGYFKPFHRTLEEISEDYQPLRTREEESGMSGIYGILRYKQSPQEENSSWCCLFSSRRKPKELEQPLLSAVNPRRNYAALEEVNLSAGLKPF